ncbi:hypothetical protein IWW45_001839 [Coemansia sp. RSA 485]|nr:hypothetical protein IWW45_001839 [Coemansia sp. RSA 485]
MSWPEPKAVELLLAPIVQFLLPLFLLALVPMFVPALLSMIAAGVADAAMWKKRTMAQERRSNTALLNFQTRAGCELKSLKTSKAKMTRVD